MISTKKAYENSAHKSQSYSSNKQKEIIILIKEIVKTKEFIEVKNFISRIDNQNININYYFDDTYRNIFLYGL